MGNKSGREGKHLPFYLAVSCLMAAVLTVSCAPVQEKIVHLRAHRQLEQHRADMAAGFYETVIEHSNRILAENGTEPPADVALYLLGEVYAHHDFTGRDYKRSQYYFEKLITDFPDSKLTSEAKTYVSLFDAIATREKETAAVEEQLLRKEQKLELAAEEKPVKKEIIVEKEKKSLPARERSTVVEDRNFEAAVAKNLQIVEDFGKKIPADAALYNLGLIYAHVDNPAKDYNKSKLYFHVLTTQFPDSEYAEEARIWLGLFETIEKIQQIDMDIEQQKKQLSR